MFEDTIPGTVNPNVHIVKMLKDIITQITMII